MPYPRAVSYAPVFPGLQSLAGATTLTETHAPTTDDIELIRMAQRGDVSAFEVLVNRYRRRAFFVAMGYLQRREDALDAVQDAFLRAFRAIKTFDLERTFYPWFYKILQNLCFSKLRTRYRAKEQSLDQHEEGEPRWELPDFSMNPELEVGRAELRSRLKRAISELRPNDREILILQHFQDCSYQEIADILGIPIGTVMSRLFNARKRLREKIEDYLNLDES